MFIFKNGVEMTKKYVAKENIKENFPVLIKFLLSTSIQSHSKSLSF